MRASGNGHDAAVRLLLSGGASVNLADEVRFVLWGVGCLCLWFDSLTAGWMDRSHVCLQQWICGSGRVTDEGWS